MADSQHEAANDDQEATDAEKVNQALAAIQGGQDDVALQLLQEVIANTPERYEQEFEEDGTLHRKFWDQEDFVHYVMRQKARGVERGVVWIGNAYPRAFYYLGFLKVKAGKFAEAIEFLDKGQNLEPDQPNFRLEKAQALSHLNQYEAALRLFDEVMAMGDEVRASVRAVALRGQGGQLIELGHLDEAESKFHTSLELDSASEVAANELEYIAQLRTGGEGTHSESVVTGGGTGIKCSVCKRPMEEGSFYNADGDIVYICPRCEGKASKKWWQFWQ